MEYATKEMKKLPPIAYELKVKLCAMPGTILNRLTQEHVFNLACIAFNETGKNANADTWRKEAVKIIKENDLVKKIKFDDMYDSELIFEETKEGGQTALSIVRHADGWIDDIGVRNPEMFYLYLDGIARGLIK